MLNSAPLHSDSPSYDEFLLPNEQVVRLATGIDELIRQVFASRSRLNDVVQHLRRHDCDCAQGAPEQCDDVSNELRPPRWASAGRPGTGKTNVVDALLRECGKPWRA
jgi:hypothetical protein